MGATTAHGGGCPQGTGRALHLTWSRLHIARGPAPDLPAQNPAGMRPGPGVPHNPGTITRTHAPCSVRGRPRGRESSSSPRMGHPHHRGTPRFTRGCRW